MRRSPRHWRSDWSELRYKRMNDIQLMITVLMHGHIPELFLEMFSALAVILVCLLRRTNPGCVLAMCAIQTARDLQCSEIDLILTWEGAIQFKETAKHRKCRLIVSQGEEELNAAKCCFRKRQYADAMKKARTAQQTFRSAEQFLPPALITVDA